jgi:xanthine dehydrogenase accessory factor
LRDRQKVFESLSNLWDQSALDSSSSSSHDSTKCPGVLATLIGVQGSYYRRPGARALFIPSESNTPGGDLSDSTLTRISGVISGGCLEKELLEVAQSVFQGQKSEIFEADLSKPEEPLLGFGTGCPGQVRFLLEPLPPAPKDRNHAAMGTRILTSYLTHGDRLRPYSLGKNSWAALRHVGINVNPLSPGFGARLIKTAGGDIFKWDPQRPALLPAREDSGTDGDIFWEVPLEQPRLVLFGSGDDGAALVDVFLTQGFFVKIIDHRPLWLERSQAIHGRNWSRRESVLPLQVEWTYVGWDDVPGDHNHQDPGLTVTAQDVVILMTHQLLRDAQILRRIVPLRPRYIGILGAHKRAQLLKEEILPTLEQTALEQETTVDHLWSTLRAPMGKAPFFTDDPWQIGLTTAYEILATLSKSADEVDP